MTESMIERVARAMERKRNPQWDDDLFEVWWARDPFFCDRVTGWPDGFRGTRKQRCMYEARAAIEAMRDIGDDIADAMNDVAIDGPGYVEFYPSVADCKTLFAAGVDAALETA